MHPPGFLIEALVDEELSPGYCTVGVQALLAHHVDLPPEVKGGMRVDQQQGVSGFGQGSCYGDPIGTLGFQFGLLLFELQFGSFRKFDPFLVIRPEFAGTDALDIPTDGALAEIHGHPGFEARE